MWIMDDCPQAMALIAAFESSDDVALEDMEHPGIGRLSRHMTASVEAHEVEARHHLGTQSRDVSVERT